MTAAHAELLAAEVERFHGRDEPAMWEAVAKRWSDLRHPYPGAYARGRAAAAHLSNRHRPAARSLLLEAHTAARQIGAVPLERQLGLLAERARIDLVPDPAELAPPPCAATELGLTGREREVLALIASGRTNREIAEELCVSGKAAATHVSNSADGGRASPAS